jgi:hypothetical protein
MSHKKESIPRVDKDFDPWFENLNSTVVAKTGGNPPEWTHIPADKVTALAGIWTDWHTAYEKTLVPHTSIDTADKKRAKDAAFTFIRPFANQYLRYGQISEDALRALGFHIPSGGRSPVHVPSTSPVLIIDTGTRRRLIISYRDEKSSRRGKPDGVHGIEVRWAILEHPPVDIKELLNSSFDTKPPLTLEFEEHERGKRVYLCGSWEIEREGEKGPPGAIEEAVIP